MSTDMASIITIAMTTNLSPCNSKRKGNSPSGVPFPHVILMTGNVWSEAGVAGGRPLFLSFISGSESHCLYHTDLTALGFRMGKGQLQYSPLEQRELRPLLRGSNPDPPITNRSTHHSPKVHSLDCWGE